VQDRSPIHAIWRPDAIGGWIDAYERGSSSAPARVRMIGAIKPFVRRHLKSVYQMLKRRAPASLSVRSMPPQEVIGRLLILKLWCDKWA
ncbi:MAG TPA: hypothetical protein VN521_00530, partial [Negativicutes bacterium]|nr:hypothetical protein [Negativicutes bacterium]